MPELNTVTSRKLFLTLMASAILLFGAYLRLENLRTNPAWYPDEGDNLNVARNLAQGRQRYFALNGPTILEGRLPLYHVVSLTAIKFWGDDLSTLRGVSALCGILSIGLLLILGSQSFGIWLGYLAASLFAFYPSAVLYNRYAFSYDLTAVWVILNLWAVHRYWQTAQRKYLALASFAAGLALTTDFVGAGVIGANLLFLIFLRKRDVSWAALIMAMPLAIYVLLMLLSDADAWLNDLNFLLFHASEHSLLLRFALFMIAYPELLQWDGWIVFGIIGLFTLADKPMRFYSWLIIVGILAVMLRFGRFDSLDFHRFVPALPLIAIGVAALLLKAIPVLMRSVEDIVDLLVAAWPPAADERPRRWIRASAGAFLIFFLFFTPFARDIFFDVFHVNFKFRTGLEQVTANSAADAFALGAFVNERVRDDDVVIASSHTNWLMHGQVTNLQQSLAYRGLAVYYPPDIDKRRWAFVPAYERARYVVLDNFTREFSANLIPAVRVAIQNVEQWPLVFQAGEYRVYENSATQP